MTVRTQYLRIIKYSVVEDVLKFLLINNKTNLQNLKFNVWATTF